MKLWNICVNIYVISIQILHEKVINLVYLHYN